MKIFDFKKEKIFLENNIRSIDGIYQAINFILENFAQDLPKNKDALIVLKPNLNNDLNALTGNSTDLRLIVALVKNLKQRGYRNIIIGDGPNVGINFSGLDVFLRLRIKKLSELLRISFVDFNKAESKIITLTKNKKAKVAKILFDCDYLINLPKIKTHIEAAMTLASKNLIGCLTGMEKRKMHSNLISNIVRINEVIKPNLHIVDGLIAMEGDGPATGTPVAMNLIVAGKSSFLVDAFCAQISGFNPMEISYLKIAREKGFLTGQEFAKLKKVPMIKTLKKPNHYLLAKIFLHNFFVYIRYWPIFDWLVKRKWVGDLIFKLHIRQDIYKDKESEIKKLAKKNQCFDCHFCEKYCPMGLKINEDNFNFSQDRCLHCLYCYLVCPKDNIKIDGRLGYLSEHVQRFGKFFKKLK